MHKPKIGLTMGDPAGVGPELVLRALAERTLSEICQLVVFGDASILQQCSLRLADVGQQIDGFPRESVIDRRGFEHGDFDAHRHVIVDMDCVQADSIEVGHVSAAGGAASFAYIQAAIDAALADKLDAVTTAPINKEALRCAGIHYPGHTEMFAERAVADRWCMMQYSPEITCTFVTVHVGYAEVPKLLSSKSILDTIELTAQALRRIRRREPVLVVCGLNPHAGEHGLFGNHEEELLIVPAIDEARRRGINVEGPLPPDTAFLPWKRKSTDAFVCMYHDQGHIPVKALAFDSAVNTTLGLKIIRTSVDHGTAYDIAWRGTANPSSLFAAIRLACSLAVERATQPTTESV